MPTSVEDLKKKYGAIYGSPEEFALLDPNSTANKTAVIAGQTVHLPDLFRKSVRENTFTNIKDPIARATAQAKLDAGEDPGVENKTLTADNVPMSGDLDQLSKQFNVGQNIIIELRKQKEAQLKAGGVPDVPQDVDSAYNRAVQANRFEGLGKEERAAAQLEWEKTGAGIEWLRGQGFAGGTTGADGAGAAGGPSAAKMAYKDSEAYQQLPQALKDLVDVSFATLYKGSEQDFVKLNNAIKQAQGIVDPFFAAQLALTRASVIDAVSRTTKNFEFGQEGIQRIRNELMEDIALRGEELGLEEQSAIAKVLRGFDNNVLDLRDAAAATGRTFGEGRFTLSEDIRQAQVEAADIIQSTRREANFERQRLALRAQRGDTEAQQKLKELQTGFGFDIRDIGREAEKVLGTTQATGIAAEAPQLAGAQFVGGVLGDLEVSRQQAFTKELSTFFGAQNLDANLVPKF